MSRRLMIAVTLGALLWSAPTLTAHDTFRIIGTITKVTPKTLEVKQTKTGKTISMKMTDAVLVTRDKKRVPVAELRAGLSVVVDACGDSLKDLEVEEVRIVPPPAKK
jgi:hypothetical protein